MPDGALLKLVKSGETEFWTKVIHMLPSIPDFLPVCYGRGVLPARQGADKATEMQRKNRMLTLAQPGVDKAARDFVVMQNVVGVM